MLTESTKLKLRAAFSECEMSKRGKQSGFLYVIFFPKARQFKVGLTKAFNDERLQAIRKEAKKDGFPTAGMKELKFVMVADMKQQEKRAHDLLEPFRAENYRFSFGGYTEFFWLTKKDKSINGTAVEALCEITGVSREEIISELRKYLPAPKKTEAHKPEPEQEQHAQVRSTYYEHSWQQPKLPRHVRVPVERTAERQQPSPQPKPQRHVRVPVERETPLMTDEAFRRVEATYKPQTERHVRVPVERPVQSWVSREQERMDALEANYEQRLAQQKAAEFSSSTPVLYAAPRPAFQRQLRERGPFNPKDWLTCFALPMGLITLVFGLFIQVSYEHSKQNGLTTDAASIQRTEVHFPLV